MAKMGWNEAKKSIEQLPVSFIIIDNRPHLTTQGVTNLLKRSKKLYVVTTNNIHPANSITDSNLEVLFYEDEIDVKNLFRRLKSLGIDNLTVQSGGEMNAELMRGGLINLVSLVVTPVMVGGSTTPTLLDGKSLETIDDLKLLKPLELVSIDKLTDSYIHLKYRVLVS